MSQNYAIMYWTDHTNLDLARMKTKGKEGPFRLFRESGKGNDETRGKPLDKGEKRRYNVEASGTGVGAGDSKKKICLN